MTLLIYILTWKLAWNKIAPWWQIVLQFVAVFIDFWLLNKFMCFACSKLGC